MECNPIPRLYDDIMKLIMFDYVQVKELKTFCLTNKENYENIHLTVRRDNGMQRRLVRRGESECIDILQTFLDNWDGTKDFIIDISVTARISGTCRVYFMAPSNLNELKTICYSDGADITQQERIMKYGKYCCINPSTVAKYKKLWLSKSIHKLSDMFEITTHVRPGTK